MQLMVYINLEEPITLPLNYNHIVQAIIYRALGIMPDYADFLHDGGYMSGKRQYKMFQFSQLMGDYRIFERKIQFQSYIQFEVRSPEPLLIRLLAESFWKHGVTFGQTACMDVQAKLSDYTVEDEELLIRMKAPLTVYSTDAISFLFLVFDDASNISCLVKLLDWHTYFFLLYNNRKSRN